MPGSDLLTLTFEKPSDGFVHAVVTVATAGTAVQCPIMSRCREVRIQAASANTGLIFVGDSTVTNAGGAVQGYSLAAGAVLGPLALASLRQLWVNAAASGDRAVFVALQ